MRALGVIAGMVLAALGSALFVRAVMPDLWLQLTQELPQRLAGVTQADSVAEQPQTEPPVTPSPVARPDDGSPSPPTAPAPRGYDAEARTDGQARETEPDALAQKTDAAVGEPLDPPVPSGTERPRDATPGALELREDPGTVSRRASHEPPQDSKVAAPGNASPAFSSADPQAVGGNEPPGAATRPTAWHGFWRPFRTERSATGFASHIGQETGLPIEIRRTPRGKYVVGFSYGDEKERERKIALIEARTGLRVLAESDR